MDRCFNNSKDRNRNKTASHMTRKRQLASASNGPLYERENDISLHVN